MSSELTSARGNTLSRCLSKRKAVYPEDQVLKTYINNLSEGAPEVIHGHLRDISFVYAACIHGGTKLDLPLINALVKRWRPKMYTFHLSYDECTITLDDVSLQLDLSTNRDVVTGPIISAGWTGTCEQLLGKVSNKFMGSKFKMKWLEDNFQIIDALVSDAKKEQFTCAFILKLIGGLLMLDKSHNSTFKVVTTTS
ncbi:hypothetical protein PVK06_004611 [Gossypium arboreum]|uniref:Aminotransferase-like plant mobile domain-containing protein n=1 Tax=Gossypium arboreum TaxID=29729 RepID=A0ABR0QSG3_GOSAR|nr:hypothetical protein PVK06_004611 [Gossypium arboreum]